MPQPDKQRDANVTLPRILSDEQVNPPIPRATIEEIKRRPVRIRPNKLIPIEWLETIETVRISGDLECGDMQDAVTICDSPPPCDRDLPSPMPIEVITLE